MPFRDSILAISPAWAQEAVAGGVQFAEGMVLDAFDTWAKEGVKARFPGISTNDSLRLIGNDRQLEQGPTEPAADFAVRLRAAFDTARGRGSPFKLLPLLAVLFSPGTIPPMRLASNRAIWHTLAAGVVTKSAIRPWIWDEFTAVPRWWRGWLIIDSSASIWTRDMWGAATGKWGDGGTWGSDMTVDQAAFLVRTMRRGKPANVLAMIVVTFDAAIFTVLGAADGVTNPAGGMGTPETRLTFNAIYSSPIGA